MSGAGLAVLAAAPVTIRHIKSGAAGAVTVLGASFTAQPPKGVNGRSGYQSGKYEAALNDEGTATLTLPNAAGEDGVLHRRRFQILTDPTYHPGDEWIEVRQDGRVLFVGTPHEAEKSRTTVTLELGDALWMQNTQRETAAGFWTHAPHDVFGHYTRAWMPVGSDDFDGGAVAGKWIKTVSGGGSITDQVGSVKLAGPGPTSIIADTASWATISLGTQRAWRAEITYDRALGTYLGALQGFEFALYQPTTSNTRIAVQLTAQGVHTTTATDDLLLDFSIKALPITPAKMGATIALEVRDRFVLFYVDGALIDARELDSVTGNVVPAIFLGSGSGSVTVHSVLVRRCDPYLIRGSAVGGGDLRVPGLLPAGGLNGTYYDQGAVAAELAATGGDTSQRYYRRLLSPVEKPYARQQDATVNFPTATPPVWQPATPPDGTHFAVRWAGAIYLDLAAADVTLRLSQLDNAARLWVGKTMYGQQIIDRWGPPTAAPYTVATGSLRTHLGQQAGWYPLRLDYAQGAGAGGIVLERSIGGAAYTVVPATALSPLGIYEAEVRFDSHAEQLKAIALAYGLQYRCEPRSLESGEFPGSVVPRIRVGRDTDKKLTPLESTDVSVKISASDVIDTLVADAAGLADQPNTAQLIAETVNFAALTPGQRMMILTAYESLADITDPILLQTRIASMLGLRTAPWEEVGARPRGHTELRDTFQLPGNIASFAWQAGDGLRLIDDQLDLRDLTPRQIIAPQWSFVPDGLGAPTVRFRQRPRSQQDALRALIRATLLPQRNYQGQLAVVSAHPSNLDAGGYTVAALPRDLADVKRCELVVGHKTDASTWTIRDYPAAAAIGTFTTVGRIDLLPYLKRRSDSAGGGGGPMMLISATGGTGAAVYQLELVVTV